MDAFRRKIMIASFRLFDVLIMIVVFLLVSSIASLDINTVSFQEFFQMRVKVKNFFIFLSLVALWHIFFSMSGLYHSRQFSCLISEIKNILKVTTLGSFAIFIFAWIFNLVMITPVFTLVFWIGTSTATIFTRIGLRYALKKIRIRNSNLRFLLIVGTNPRAVHFAKKIETKNEDGYHVLGFIDKDWAGIENFKTSGYELVSDFHGFNSFIRANVVDEVVIFLPMKSCYSEASQVLAECEKQGIISRNLIDIFNLKLAWSKAEYFEGEPIISHYTGAMGSWQVVLKRILDIVLAGTLLIFIIPVFSVIGLLIKLDSAGPVFFIQERIGLNKRKFKVYKFRTMIDGAEKRQIELENLNEVSGPVFKIKADPRITRIGKYLRKASVDELPQLINVIKGDMSLVGPRPLTIRDYEGFNQDKHRRRFSVLPGITCLWQINGRNNIPFEKWMSMDLEYIDNWSIWLDFHILTKSVKAVWKATGAA